MRKNSTTKIIYAPGSAVRVTTTEIDSAIQELENAFIDGRLDDAELEVRMSKAIKAKTEGDLSELINDLTRIERDEASFAPTSRAPAFGQLKASMVALFSGVEQNGRFILPKKYRIEAIFGGCLIDLRKAHLESADSTIKVTAIFGGVKIIVPPGVRIEVHSTPIFGGVSKKGCDNALPFDAPVILIHADVIFGGVEITTKE